MKLKLTKARPIYPMASSLTSTKKEGLTANIRKLHPMLGTAKN